MPISNQLFFCVTSLSAMRCVLSEKNRFYKKMATLTTYASMFTIITSSHLTTCTALRSPVLASVVCIFCIFNGRVTFHFQNFIIYESRWGITAFVRDFN